MKYFKAIYWNMLQNKYKKTNDKKALVFRCENLVRSAVQCWKIYRYQRKIQFNKRQIIFNSITAIDQSITTQTAYDALKSNLEWEKDRLVYCRGQIVYNFMKRIFDVLKDNSKYHKQVKSNFKIMDMKHKTHRVRQIMTVWMRALD